MSDAEREEWVEGIMEKVRRALAKERDREIVAAWQAERDAERAKRMAAR